MQHTARHYAANQRIIYHRPAPMPATRALASTRVMPSWHPAWRQALLALMHRPLLVLTLAVAGIFLFSAASEAVVAQRLSGQVRQAQQTNRELQRQLTRTAAEITDRTNPAAITAAAQKLGWVVVTPTPAP